ncbi:MAG TPA: zinc-dependent alcohol dehydrogenase [Bryobacteraceae bacterium]|nr:zinc-dependent alcohol dehydrogenase [Bryobacteraceae bacterium]
MRPIATFQYETRSIAVGHTNSMRAVCWYGTHDVRVTDVPEPKLINSRDAIVRITSTAICGSDLHLYNGYIPSMQAGDILGHEFMGEVVEVAKANGLRRGDRVVVPFPIACGSCWFCRHQLTALCDNSNPNAAIADMMYGTSGAGIFGYSHIYGGFAGGQAEYARVPFADFGCLKIPDRLTDEQVLFLTDVFPTGYMAAENCNIQPGDTIAVWGCGPVGLFAITSAYLLGAERVIALDRFPERLRMAAERCGAETLNYEHVDVIEQLKNMSGGRGPDACIDAVGMEAHGTTADAIYDQVKHSFRLETDRPHVLRQCIQACRKGGTVSIPGVYGGLIDKLNIGAAFAKGLTFRMGQTHVHKYLRPLLERIAGGDIDPSFVITHRMRLNDAPHAYDIFLHKQDECVKVVLKP